MSELLLKNGVHLEAGGNFVPQEIWIEKGLIKKIAPRISEPIAHQIDLHGKLISAGFLDMHVHLREPGFEYKETIETGTRAAARGGFTTVACMPNTKPPIDSIETLQYVLKKAEEVASTRVLPIPAMTKGMQGKELTDYHAFKQQGIFALSDDGLGVQEDALMRQAFLKAKENGLFLLQHCEFCHLSEGGAFHQGKLAQQKKIKGIVSASEYKMVERDLQFVRETRVPYHVLHVSTKESVALVRNAKKEGLPVTAEVTPHHLLLCDEDIPGENTNFKMNPPLRGKADQMALIEGILDKTIDFIATDHAPHTATEKAQDIHLAPFGVVGSELAFPLLYTHLVLKKILSLQELLELFTSKPAIVFQLPWGILKEGFSADITVLDLEERHQVEAKDFSSKCQNTPFLGWTLQGWPVMTFYKGKKVWG